MPRCITKTFNCFRVVNKEGISDHEIQLPCSFLSFRSFHTPENCDIFPWKKIVKALWARMIHCLNTCLGEDSLHVQFTSKSSRSEMSLIHFVMRGSLSEIFPTPFLCHLKAGILSRISFYRVTSFKSFVKQTLFFCKFANREWEDLKPRLLANTVLR